MSELSPLSEQERADLVAYLDGELHGEAARALEAKLSLNPAARAEADSLRRTWGMLDYLPNPQPSLRFTHRTLERLSPLRLDEQQRRQSWRRRFLGLGWVAALLLAGWTGYAGYNWFVPRQPGEPPRANDRIEDLDFWRGLAAPDLFGDETLPEPQRRPSRSLDRAFAQLDAKMQKRLEKAADRYADWRERLPDIQRQQIDETKETKERLQRIRDIREQQWIERLPRKVREHLEKLPPQERASQIVQLHKQERQQRQRWSRPLGAKQRAK
jgi:hypothetical protein